MIWVISLRGLGRYLKAIAKPLIILVIIILALWLITGWPRTDRKETEPPILPEEYLPSNCRFLDEPQIQLAASFFMKGLKSHKLLAYPGAGN